MSRKVTAAALEVHRRLGPGFPECAYEQALRIELARRQVPFEPQKQVPLHYDGKLVATRVLDLLVDGTIVVELKAAEALSPVHFAQVRSHLRATGAKVGLLLNVNSPTLVIKRLVN